MAGRKRKTFLRRCSFCGKTEKEVPQLFTGGEDLYICSFCIETCNGLMGNRQSSNMPQGVEEPVPNIEEEQTEKEGAKQSSKSSLPTPAEIKAHLDEYVIGQDDAKKTLAVAVYNHYLRINSSAQNGVEIQKSNVLLMGPTGSGKTYLLQTLAKMLNVPFAIGDCTSYTEAGFVGEDIENVLRKLIEDADGDVEKAEKGIVYFDEVDKLATRHKSASTTLSVGTTGVQQRMLKILEGTIAEIPKGQRKHSQEECIPIDTTNILFVCGGAFVGLDDIIASRNDHGSLGFSANIRDKEKKDIGKILKEVTPQDLSKFGMIPEFIGRLPVTVSLDALSKEDLVSILSEPKNALTKQYQKIFDCSDVKLEFEKEALERIAEIALERNTGARGLRSILEHAMRDVMFDVPSDRSIKKVIITKGCIDGTEGPKITRKKVAV